MNAMAEKRNMSFEKAYVLQRLYELVGFSIGYTAVALLISSGGILPAIEIVFTWYFATLYLPLTAVVAIFAKKIPWSFNAILALQGPIFFIVYTSGLIFMLRLPVFTEGSLMWVAWCGILMGLILSVIKIGKGVRAAR